MNKRDMIKSMLGMLVALPMLSLADTSVANIDDIKKALEVTLRKYAFEPNDAHVRDIIRADMVKVIEKFKVYDYAIMVHAYDDKYPSRLQVHIALKLIDSGEFYYLPITVDSAI